MIIRVTVPEWIIPYVSGQRVLESAGSHDREILRSWERYMPKPPSAGRVQFVRVMPDSYTLATYDGRHQPCRHCEFSTNTAGDAT